MNMDYSICQALEWDSNGLPKARIIYDIACQWSKKFKQRVEVARFLSLFEQLDLEYGVGKWHLAAHKWVCFALFSLNFMSGAGQIDGEILETLWAGLNKISGSTRTMSKAHRRETIDAHMNDSNWKKLVGIVAALVRKYVRGVKELAEMEEVFEELDSRCDEEQVEQWRKDEEKAMKKRGKYLGIYNVREEEGRLHRDYFTG